MQTQELKKGVIWTGILDPGLLSFDIVMETKYGTTYNSYFIDADKPTVIETVKEKYHVEFLENLKKHTDINRIQYVICNHTEPDHSGSVKHLIKANPEITVVGSGQAITYLSDMIDMPFKSLKVKDGDILDLGNKKIRFIAAPNLHWPDSMFSYLEEDGYLFTCDSFGAHFSHPELFDDKVGNYDDAFHYYFDVILKPYSKFMLRAIERIRPLPIQCICPGHGPILRTHWKRMVDLSEELSNKYLEKLKTASGNILIAYISAYGYTKEMAAYISQGIKSTGDVNVIMADIENISLGELEEKIVASDAILIGSPTINQNTLLPVYKMFALLNPIRDKGKYAAAFGSYGWSGEAVNLIENHLRNMKFNIICQSLAAKFNPNTIKAEQFVEFGKRFALEVTKNKINAT